eukprot:14723712-Alexandrium_andersonii.AAC.1
MAGRRPPVSLSQRRCLGSSVRPEPDTAKSLHRIRTVSCARLQRATGACELDAHLSWLLVPRTPPPPPKVNVAEPIPG